MTNLSQSSVSVDPAFEICYATIRYFSDEFRGVLGCGAIGLGLRGQGYGVTVVEGRVRFVGPAAFYKFEKEIGKRKRKYL